VKPLPLRSGGALECAPAPGGLIPGERGQQTGGTRFWVRAPAGAGMPAGPWHLTACRSEWGLRQWASAADSLEDLLSAVGVSVAPAGEQG